MEKNKSEKESESHTPTYSDHSSQTSKHSSQSKYGEANKTTDSSRLKKEQDVRQSRLSPKIISLLSGFVMVGLVVYVFIQAGRDQTALDKARNQLNRAQERVDKLLEEKSTALASCEKDLEGVTKSHENLTKELLSSIQEQVALVLNTESRYERLDVTTPVDEMLSILQERAREREEAHIAAQENNRTPPLGSLTGKPPHYWSIVDLLLNAMEAEDYELAYKITRILVAKKDASSRVYYYASRALRQIYEKSGRVAKISPYTLIEHAKEAAEIGISLFPMDSGLNGAYANALYLMALRESDAKKLELAQRALESVKKAITGSPDRGQWYYLAVKIHRLLWKKF